MDLLLSVVLDSNFVECARVEGRPVVFHCVPGAGKSTLIRKLLNLDSRFYAITFGKEDSPNLSGKYIRKACNPSEIPEKKLLLVDEYNCGDISRYQTFAVFGDPLQKIGVTLQANFINHRSERFGKNTCKLLRDLGFEVHSDREDCVEVKEIIGGEPEGFVVAIEPEAVQIVIDSGYECYCVEELRGVTAEVVTFVAASNTPPVKFREAIFVALTRHRSKLLILAPDAYYGPAQLQ